MRERHIYGKGYAVQKYPIDMDLQYDLNDICFNKMQAANIAYPDHNNAVLQYFNLIHRQIEPRPRIVHKSDEFVCPAGYDKALEKFEQCIRMGSNLLPFLSTKVIEADKKDDLLNSLGIWHFHLSIRPREDGFVKRNQWLILAVVTDSDFYMLKVCDHSNDYWTYDRSLNEIIERNWPELFDQYELKGITGIDDLNLDEYIQARKAHANMFYQLQDGRIIMGRGT